MLYDPLLDTITYFRTWQEISEDLQGRIERAVRKSGDTTSHLNVLDLIDDEASAYWREWGLDLHAGKKFTKPTRSPRLASSVPAPSVAANPLFD